MERTRTYPVKKNYDLVVIGAGSTGATLAGRLSGRQNRSILVLEAGSAPRSLEDFPQTVLDPSDYTAMAPGHPVNWSFPGESRPGVEVSAPRGRIIGGSGSINGAYFIRGRRSDFDRWEELGNDKWSYARTLPYFRKLEHDADFTGELHGVGGPIPVRREDKDRAPEFTAAFTAACVGLGYPEELDKNGDEPEGVGPVPHNIGDGLRFSPAIAYLLPNLERPNLDVCGDALVGRVLFDRGRACAVEFELDGVRQRVNAGEVILAAGALRTPQLLMLSGIGPAAQLSEHDIPVVCDSPGVGAELVDHPDVVLSYGIDPRVRRIKGRGAMTSALHWKAWSHEPASDGSVEILPYVMTLAEAMGIDETPPPGARNDDPMHNPFIFMRLMQQHSRGRVFLRSADPHDGPGLSWNFLTDPRDMGQYREVVRVAASIFESDAMRDIGGRALGLDSHDLDTDAALDAWILSHLSTWGPGHGTSTCKMGPETDALAVVDQDGLVRGVSGLRIADTSIFPTIIARGTNATAVMVGERLAELIP
ncbi:MULTISPECIES: mycofactocin system GMC family oxidoreductase MftG [unclassified Mycobacterium]|uniref:mycofactocin dehydrogenase MftG n=1 Tax=unclassified Mycobacterium TaxID=2642494 RepID=UPI0029C89586|nr:MULTISPECIES: mycofactocin system GMC family oxidoreductase MftG [unclassified Mycobacterium]